MNGEGVLLSSDFILRNSDYENINIMESYITNMPVIGLKKV